MQRLGKNIGGYFGETIDIRSVLRGIEAAAHLHGWRREIFHADDSFNWFALYRSALTNTQTARRVYISTGIHGDEAAGPLAVLRLLQENQWPANIELSLLPCLNPNGFVLNRRENQNGIDLNRDYLHLQTAEVRAHVGWLEKQPPFDVCFCLHEDWESHGFYVYELNPDGQPSLAEDMTRAVEKVCPLDLSEIIEGRPAEKGIIRPTADPRSRPQWPEAFWLFTHKTRLSYTLESPSDFPLPVRVNALVEGVRAALRKSAA